MEKRVVIFLVISLAVILLWDFILKQFGLIPPPIEQPHDAATAPSSVTSPPPTEPPGPPPAGAGRPDAEAARLKPEEPPPLVEREEPIEVVTPLYRAVFSNRGAVIRNWELRRYAVSSTEREKPVELMHLDAKFRRPLAVRVANEQLSRELNDGLYTVEKDFTVLDADHPTGHVTFRYASPKQGIQVQKRLTFHHDRYVVDVQVSVEGLGEEIQIGLGTNFGIVEWGEGFIGLIGPASVVEDKLVKDTPDNEEERKGPVRWVALQDKYFLSVLMPTGATAAVIKKEGEKLVSAWVRFPGTAATPAASLQLYAGPKEYDTLRAFNLGLEDTIDFGWFIYGSWDIVRAVAKPLFYVLRFLHDYTHNYGLAIILLTVGIKLLFVPLQYKSYKSMKDMQLVQPKVALLQQKYKDDRERLNRELIKLYREHKVNPVGGCLPMLLQTPVFVALFNILYMTIDLRQAPFMLWIKDLSVQDPYYVLPVIMGASMILQQKIMPTTMDPTQAKIMLLLPAFMTLLFLTFPAGLVLYWLTNNVLTITQQFVTDRYIFKRPTFAPAPQSAGLPQDGGDNGRSTGKKKDRAPEKPQAETKA
jgi:YidC/Oxa1 family membrane protein insertase